MVAPLLPKEALAVRPALLHTLRARHKLFPVLDRWPRQLGPAEENPSKIDMAAVVLDGRRLAGALLGELAARVAALGARARDGPPALAILLVGADAAALRHARRKSDACRRVGIRPIEVELSSQAATAEVLSAIDWLNADPRVHGVFLQHPVPAEIDERRCFDRIALAKDVGGDSSLSLGKLALGESGFGAVTPAAILRLLAGYRIEVEGKEAVVVGRGPLIGKPVALMLLAAHATVTLCHARTPNLPALVRRAEIVVGAVGKPRFIRGDWIRDGAVVIDAGLHPDRSGKGAAERGGMVASVAVGEVGLAAAGDSAVELRTAAGAAAVVGDVDLSPVVERCSAYTPVPGGVGPMTIAMLLERTVEAAEHAAAA